ncbi:MAG: MlaD family protein [Oligoflexia bacterium]|nr:MlaD family protein [Oligoflexia bacterium]
MNSTQATLTTRIKVGIFTLTGLLLIGVFTALVNDKPFWWRPCQLVHINVEDATGLKKKSSVRSLGLEIGYLKTVVLSETHVELGICITESVEVLPATRAYIRAEGFLGDKFVELKPVKYVGEQPKAEQKPQSSVRVPLSPMTLSRLQWIDDALFVSAGAQQQAPPARTVPRGERQIPVGEGSQDMQNLVKRVDSLVNEMTSLTNNLKDAINPEELRSTMRQLNRTLENASRTLAPEGGLTQTAQRTLAKLEDAIEQLRDLATRINQGEGSVGMILNDPTYAEELRAMIRNANKLISKVGDVRFIVDIGGENIQGYDGGRGWFRLAIWPKKERYYLLGLSVDPRGRRTVTETTVEVSGGPVTQHKTTSIEQTGILLTGMVGNVFFERLDLSIGALYGDGAVSVGGYLGPRGIEDRLQLRADIYSRGTEQPVDARIALIVNPWRGLFVRGGVESVRRVNGATPWTYGAGVTFEDEDIKLLFALR